MAFDDDDVTFDKLTSHIFSLLETNFLFGCHHFSSGKVRILSIDAGLNDAALHSFTLLLQSSLRKHSSDSTAHIADFFDVVAGSASAGLLATLLFTRGLDGRPLCSVDQAFHLLRKRSPSLLRRIFRRSSKKKKKSSIEKMVGHLTLKDTLKSVLIPCYDLSTGAPFLFSRVDALEMDGYDFSLADVCRATSGDGKVEIMSVDGQTRIQAVGAGMKNPTGAAMTHVLNNKKEFPYCNGVEDVLVVSIGNADEEVHRGVSMAFGETNNNYLRIPVSNKFTSDQEKLEWVGQEVVKEHERRRNSILPTVNFKQLSPRTSSSSSSTTFSSSYIHIDH